MRWGIQSCCEWAESPGIFYHPRTEKKRSGGGIGLLYNTSMKIERADCNSYASFEYLEVKLHTAPTVFRIAVVYRPPSPKDNKLTSAQFFHDFNDLLEHFSVSSGRLLIMGDFNLHVINHLVIVWRLNFLIFWPLITWPSMLQSLHTSVRARWTW